MLFSLYQFADQFPVLNLFRYLTFRAGASVVTAMIVCFVFGPAIIPLAESEARPKASPFAPMARKVTSSPSKARRPWAV